MLGATQLDLLPQVSQIWHENPTRVSMWVNVLAGE